MARRPSRAPDGPATGACRRVLHDTSVAPHVLLVDDSDDTREMYAEYFEHQGFRVTHAVDGDHALWKVITLKPDLVVMDMAMPILDGWEATEHIKTHASTKHIPVIALTGHVTKPNLTRATHVGSDAVLTKPCTPARLFSVARRLLAK